MKIALIGNDYFQQFPLISVGGIESCVETLAQGLFEKGYEFFCIVPQRNKKRDYYFEVIEVPYVPYFIQPRDQAEFVEYALPIICQKKADVVLSQSHWSVQPLSKLNIPSLVTFHDSCEKNSQWMPEFPNIYYRFISKFQYNNWVKEDWEIEKSVQIYTGLDSREYSFEPKKENYFLWIASLDWGLQAKGLDTFIELAKYNPDRIFYAFGDGNYELSLKLYYLSKEIKNFIFKGPLFRGENHINVFKKARALILPTKIPDTFPRTVLESLSKGTPVIGTNRGSLPEVLNDGYGQIANNFEQLNSALNQEFDHRKIYDYSKEFHVHYEVDNIVNFLEKII